MEKIAVYSCTRNLYDDMEISARTLIANSDVDAVYFLIEDEKFPRKLPSIIKTIDVSHQQIFGPHGPNMDSKFTYMAMMRACLHELFPDQDKILSLDVDTVCVNDVSDIWDLPLDDVYFSASVEPKRSYKDGLMYCNTGVALYNLEKLRDGKADEVIEVLNRKKFTYLEQDVFNYLCQGRIFPMNSVYNWNDYTEPLIENDLPRIVHYAGYSKWQLFGNWLKAKELRWEDILGEDYDRS